MFVHCYNPECKPIDKCRRPAHSFGEEFGRAQIRTGVEKFGCDTCGSSFVDVEQQLCYACQAKEVPLPHTIAVVKVVCAECKQSKCRELKDFVLNAEEDECAICCDDLEENTLKVSTDQPAGWPTASNVLFCARGS